MTRDLAGHAAGANGQDGSMGLRDIRHRLTAPSNELHLESLVGRWDSQGVVAIAQVEPRCRVRIGGEVEAVQVVPRAGSPSLEVSVHDGTGRAVARFTGRRAIAGIGAGRELLLEGLATVEKGHVVVVNPSYTLLPA